MKSTLMFRDHVNAILCVFDQWNECEQTVALCSMFKNVSPTQARFLMLVLEQKLSKLACTELKMREQRANDSVFISGLCKETKEIAVAQLLSHLPLLHPGNEETKNQYLRLIPKIIAHSIENSVHIEESRQLLSYSLIHPAIDDEDKGSLHLWLRQLEARIRSYSAYHNRLNGAVDSLTMLSNGTAVDNFGNGPFNMVGRLDTWRPSPLPGINGTLTDANGYSMLNGLGSNSLPPGIGSSHMTLHAMNSAPPGGMSSLSSHPDGTHTLPLAHNRVRRSNSLTPPGSASQPANTTVTTSNNRCPRVSTTTSQPEWVSEPEVLCRTQIPVSHNSDHAPLSPQSSVTSSGSGSESHVEEKSTFQIEGSGMKDVPSWLKSLRLHKYSYLFAQLTYDEMMNLTESQLELQNVTKGARHKIVLSIQKLKIRQNNLRALEKDIQEGTGIRTALTELKSMIQTPIKAFHRFSGSRDSPNSEIDESGSISPDPPGSLSIASVTNSLDSESSAQIAEGDLPGQFTRLMGKICTNLLVSSRPEDENLNLFLMLIDKCLSHEAFTPQQKRRLFSWKQQVQKIWHPLPPRRSLDTRQNRSKWNGVQNHNGSPVPPQLPEFGASATAGTVAIRRRHPLQYPQATRVSSLTRQGLVSSFPSPQRNACQTVIKRPSLQDHLKPHVQVQRTHSAPVGPNPVTTVFGKSEVIDSTNNDPELNTRLESLCLSVTEHALGGFDGGSPLF